MTNHIPYRDPAQHHSIPRALGWLLLAFILGVLAIALD
jgi:hypothetical protein